MESNKSQALVELWNLTLGFLKSMSLKCALDLGLADAISNNGQPMTLTQLHSAISLPPSKKSQLRRLMRLLTHFGFFLLQTSTSDSTSTAESDEPVYDLTPLSRLAIQKDESTNFLPFLRLHLHDVHVKPSLYMGDWFLQEEKKLPVEMAHGCMLWDLTSKDPILNTMFNDGMVSGSCLFHDAIIRRGGDIFKGVESLVDVGGGKGAIAQIIAKSFPHVQCTVLDLPHVVSDSSNDGVVKFVSGDMFNYIPPADVVLLKWILHDWSDEECIKILERCKDAIPSKEAGGKVLVLETVVGRTSSATISEESQVLFDMLMLNVTGGAERDEKEWQTLFTRAGFTSYNIIHTEGFMSIIEVYP